MKYGSPNGSILMSNIRPFRESNQSIQSHRNILWIDVLRDKGGNKRIYKIRFDNEEIAKLWENRVMNLYQYHSNKVHFFA